MGLEDLRNGGGGEKRRRKGAIEGAKDALGGDDDKEKDKEKEKSR